MSVPFRVRVKARRSLSPPDQIAGLVSFVQRALQERADPRKAVKMAAYMKTSMPFYGVQTPQRAEILREAGKRFSVATHQDYQRAVLGLWTLKHREEKYLALGLARLWPEFIVPESLTLYRRLIQDGAWWDFVDETAAHLVGRVLLDHREQIAPIIDKWIEARDMWVRRAAIICQLSHKDKTDHVRLFRYCVACSAEKEFFIRKAIGWALRQYSYSAPRRVRDFLAKNRDRLSPLTYREASRVMIAKGKMG